MHTGRPENAAGRLEKEIACYDLLDSLGVSYTRVDHDFADTIEACEAVEQVLGEKNLQEPLSLQPAEDELLSSHDARREGLQDEGPVEQLGVARLSFASPEDMLRLLNITPGSVSVLGLMNDKENEVQLVIDKPVLEDEKFGCHPVINSSTLAISTKDLMEKILPAVHHEAILVELPEEAVEA